MWFFKRKEEKQDKEERTLTVTEESDCFILVKAKNYLYLNLVDIEEIESKYNAQLVHPSRVSLPPDYEPSFDLLMRKKV